MKYINCSGVLSLLLLCFSLRGQVDSAKTLGADSLLGVNVESDTISEGETHDSIRFIYSAASYTVVGQQTHRMFAPTKVSTVFTAAEFLQFGGKTHGLFDKKGNYDSLPLKYYLNDCQSAKKIHLDVINLYKAASRYRKNAFGIKVAWFAGIAAIGSMPLIRAPKNKFFYVLTPLSIVGIFMADDLVDKKKEKLRKKAHDKLEECVKTYNSNCTK